MSASINRFRLPLTGVRVSGGHRCEATAPTEAAAETVAWLCRDGGGNAVIKPFSDYLSVCDAQEVIIFHWFQSVKKHSFRSHL